MIQLPAMGADMVLGAVNAEFNEALVVILCSSLEIQTYTDQQNSRTFELPEWCGADHTLRLELVISQSKVVIISR